MPSSIEKWVRSNVPEVCSMELLRKEDNLLNGIMAHGTGWPLDRAGHYRLLQPALDAELYTNTGKDHGSLLAVQANHKGVIILIRKMRSLFSYFLLTSRLLLDGDYLLNGITADGTGSLLARAGNFRPLQPTLEAELPVPAGNDHGRLLTVQANGTGVIVLFRYLRLLFSYVLLCLAPSERLARWAILAAAVFPVFEDLPRERAEQSPTGSAQLAGPHVVEHVLHDAAAWKIALRREVFQIRLFCTDSYAGCFITCATRPPFWMISPSLLLHL